MTIIWEYAIIWEDEYGRNDQNVEQRKFLALQGKVMVGSVHAGARFAHLWIPIISTAPLIHSSINMQMIKWHFSYIRVTGRGISASKCKPSEVEILNSLMGLGDI